MSQLADRSFSARVFSHIKVMLSTVRQRRGGGGAVQLYGGLLFVFFVAIIFVVESGPFARTFRSLHEKVKVLILIVLRASFNPMLAFAITSGGS